MSEQKQKYFKIKTKLFLEVALPADDKKEAIEWVKTRLIQFLKIEGKQDFINTRIVNGGLIKTYKATSTEDPSIWFGEEQEPLNPYEEDEEEDKENENDNNI